MREGERTPRSVPFSARTNWDTSENAWARALSSRRKQDQPIYDLTASNPTQCGFSYGVSLLEALSKSEALRYEPAPQGLLAAREAVCQYYEDHANGWPSDGRSPITPNQVFLTTSTSEAYSFLFRLLCDPGDEVLIAQPSYPLFDFIAALDDVTLMSYPLFYDHGWHIDLHTLRQKISSRTRAIVVVHPNNPTGHFTSEKDRASLESLCEEFGLALIVDEVFLDYGLEKTGASFVTGAHPVLTFVLSGLSKIAALPQMKLSWIAAAGPEVALRTAIDRLEVIADTFLSLNAPIQLALPQWLGERRHIQEQVKDRVQENLAVLDDLLAAQTSIERLQFDGGWSVILRAAALHEGEETALWLMVEHGIAVHPGNFYGMPGDGYFVLSLLPEKAIFSSGVGTLLQLLAART